jgi:hypothetical protein
LYNENALEDAAIDERDPEEGVVLLFAGILEELVARVTAGVVDGDGADLLGYKAGKSLMQRHAKGADAAGVETERGGKYQVRAIRFKQVG